VDRLYPRWVPEPEERTAEVKLDRGGGRQKPLYPANAGPIANGPLVTISTGGLLPWSLLDGPPLPLPRPRGKAFTSATDASLGHAGVLLEQINRMTFKRYAHRLGFSTNSIKM
jgi:hypothetical protein